MASRLNGPLPSARDDRASALEGRRPTWIEIDLNALAHNLRTVMSQVGSHRRVVAVVKANAYGHGAVAVSRRLQAEGVRMLGVAIPEEGLELRDAGISLPILVMGAADPSQIPLMLSGGLTPAVYSLPFLEAVLREATRAGRPVDFHMKVDTGMGRLGILPHEIPAALEALASASGAARLEGLFTTLSCSDDPDDPLTGAQVARFREIRDRILHAGHSPAFSHAANSGGVIDHPDSWLDTVRPGLILYGAHPSARSSRLDLRPVLSLRTRVMQLKQVPAGTPLGYGRAFVTSRPSVIGTLAVGYADGVARMVATSGHVLVRGRRAPYAGRISMDLSMVDVTGVPGAQPGDEAVVLGRQMDEEITADQFAGWSGTIPYEALCRLGPRVPLLHLGVLAGGEAKSL